MDDEGQKRTALLCRSMILFDSLCPGWSPGIFCISCIQKEQRDIVTQSHNIFFFVQKQVYPAKSGNTKKENSHIRKYRLNDLKCNIQCDIIAIITDIKRYVKRKHDPGKTRITRRFPGRSFW